MTIAHGTDAAAQAAADAGNPAVRWFPETWSVELPTAYRVGLRYEPNRAVVTVIGLLDDAAAHALDTVLQVLEHLPAAVVVDVYRVNRMADVGARALYASAARRRRAGLCALVVRDGPHTGEVRPV